MEVILKAVLGVVNWQIGTEVDFHNILHGSRACRATRTASLKFKLIQKLMAMREEVLYEVKKAYDALDWEHFIEILVGYVIGPHMERVVHLEWDHLLMMA